jgi:hypothetical protein
VTGISHQRHRITGVAEYPLHNHECSVKGDSNGKRGSETRGCVNVAPPPGSVPATIMIVLFVM